MSLSRVCLVTAGHQDAPLPRYNLSSLHLQEEERFLLLEERYRQEMARRTEEHAREQQQKQTAEAARQVRPFFLAVCRCLPKRLGVNLLMKSTKVRFMLSWSQKRAGRNRNILQTKG